VLASINTLLSEHRSADEAAAAVAAARKAGSARLEAHALEILGTVESLLLGRSTRGRELLQQSIAVARRAGDIGREVSAESRLAVLHSNRLELDRAVDHAEAALTIARTAGDPALICQALDGRKLVAFALGDISLLRETIAELLPELRGRGDLWLLQFALAEGALLPAAAGNWELAEHQLEQALEINRSIGRGYRAYLLAIRSWFALWRGSVDVAVETGRQAVEAASARSHLGIAWSASNLGAALLAAGDVDGAATELRRGLSAAQRADMGLQAARCDSLLAAAELHAGDTAAAAARAVRAAGELARISAPTGRAFLHGADAYAAVAEVLAATGRAVEGEALLEPVRAVAETAGWPGVAARLLVAAGSCAAALGRPGDAATRFREAEALARTAGCVAVEQLAGHTVTVDRFIHT